MVETTNDTVAVRRMLGMLEYIRVWIKLDEKVVSRLEQHVLPDGGRFALHQHELGPLPGLQLDVGDEDGPVWLRIARQVRTRPPEIDIELAPWISLSSNPDAPCSVNETIVQRVDRLTRDKMLQEGELFPGEDQPSLRDEPDEQGAPRWFDLSLRLERRPAKRAAIEEYLAGKWRPWADTERPLRTSIAIYQRLFEIAQSLSSGNTDQSELVCGFGVSRWRRAGEDVEIPIMVRGVEILINEDRQADITIRPRSRGAEVELRALQRLAGAHFNQAEDAARRTLRLIETAEPEGASPFRPESFEPILRQCASQLDPDGVYMPDRPQPSPYAPLPPVSGEHLEVSNRFVFFARRRTSHVILADIEKLKKKLASSGEGQAPKIEGAARTLLLGPQDYPGGVPEPPGPIGGPMGPRRKDPPDDDALHGDLFFPKPFNDDQVSIVRRLERSDGVVVQGPPGTGKTHTIANIISHMLATGKRVLVISHGEMALSVVRDQLPSQLRDLAISITTNERDGEKQVEKAVDVMLGIVNDYASDSRRPLRRIQEHESSIIATRERLKKIEEELAEIAAQHLSASETGELIYDRALRLIGDKESHQWFADRPKNSLAECALDVGEVEAAFRTACEIKDALKYIDVELANPTDLPDPSQLENWRADVIQAQAIGSSLAYANEIRRLLTSRQASGAEALAETARALADAWRMAQQTAWSAGVLEQARSKSPLFMAMRAEFSALATSAAELHDRAQPFVARRVDAPVPLPPQQELDEILEALGSGKDPFGFFAFKLKQYRTAISAIQINGAAPQSSEDWTHVARCLAVRREFVAFENRWSSAFTGIDVVAPAPQIGSTLGAIATVLRDVLELPDRLAEFHKRVARETESYDQADVICASSESLVGFADALAAKLSQLRLAATHDQIEMARSRIPRGDLDLHRRLRGVLERIGEPDADGAALLAEWSGALRDIDHVRGLRREFQRILAAAQALEQNGAGDLAARLRQGQAGLERGDWKAAWDWWVEFDRMSALGAMDRLSSLHKDRTEAEDRLRRTFGDLVRERAFFALAQSMPGIKKSALRAFADIIRKIGKGAGKRVASYRRELRQAMDKCYDAVPCWIMPAWRVSEQLPAEIESFDLVILDEASQSDARDLPALLRGKKILVVGDDRQVSPGASFIKTDDIDRLHMNYLQDMPFPTLLLPGSSIYELARVMFPDKFVMLKEHFRSVEPIIHFSMQFYSEPLIPLRIPTASERLDPPLVDIFVQDGRRRGKQKINDREAEVIVDEIEALISSPDLSHVRTASGEAPRSIGVISLVGGDQARFIQNKLIERIGAQKFVAHKIVCGDSASLQGNERDIVYLSMIVDGEGRVSSATADQYQQRFNVALSRARDRLVLVRSVEENRLNPADLKAKIIKHFRDPMPQATIGNDLVELCQSGFERSIFCFLAEGGFNVRPQVGSVGYFIDMVVEGEGGRRLAIECDGDFYHGPDRWADDMRRQRILERVGWHFWRVFGSTFALDPDGVKQDLLRTLEAHGIRPIQHGGPIQSWTVHRIVGAKPGERTSEGSEDRRKPESPSSAPDGTEEPFGLAIGDQIVLRYLDRQSARPVAHVITRDASDPRQGLLSIHSPLAKLLAEHDEGDEFFFEAGGEKQHILFVARQRSSTLREAAE